MVAGDNIFAYDKTEKESLDGITPDGIKTWLAGNNDERGLAEAAAYVWNKTFWLMCDLDDTEDKDSQEYKTTEDAYNEWLAVNNELNNRIISVVEGEIKAENVRNRYKDKNNFTKLAPLMYRNGYKSDGSGTWIRQETNEQIGEDEAFDHIWRSQVVIKQTDEGRIMTTRDNVADGDEYSIVIGLRFKRRINETKETEETK
jgi:hypothetical protein